MKLKQSLRYAVFILLLGNASGLSADTLTLKQAISWALENNHGLKIAELQSDIAENLATPGNAGLMPKVNVTGGVNYSNQNTTIVFNGSIPKNEVEGAVSKGYNGSVGLTYTLFDGLGVVYTYKKLQAQSDRSNMQWLLTTENTIIQVVNMYLEILKLQNASINLGESLKISEEKRQRAQKAFELGVKTGLERLNAQVDFTNDSINLANAIFSKRGLIRNLNWLMGQDIQKEYYLLVPDFQSLTGGVEPILEQSLKNNRNFIMAELSKEIAGLDYSIAFSKRMPVLTGSLSYGVNHAQNGAGIVLSSDVAGLSGGLNLNFNLFDGLKVKTQIENAQLAIEIQEELKKETTKSISRDVLNAFEGYRYSESIMQSEMNHVNAAEMALKRSMEGYALGTVNSTDLRIAQLNLLNAQMRRFNTSISVLKYYYELKRLNGSLLSE